MTTVIACKPLLVMVADSRIAHGGGGFKSSKKVRKVGKFLAGVAGDFAFARSYLETFAAAARTLDGRAPPKLAPFEQEFELMVLSEWGLWIYGDDGSAIEVEEEFYVIGSGAPWASACLRTQELTYTAYNPAMALDVACEFSAESALPMVEISLSKVSR